MLYEIHLRRRTEEQTTDCATHEKQRRGIPHPSAHHHSISFSAAAGGYDMMRSVAPSLLGSPLFHRGHLAQGWCTETTWGGRWRGGKGKAPDKNKVGRGGRGIISPHFPMMNATCLMPAAPPLLACYM